MNRSNPILRAIEAGRATLAEQKEALFALMDEINNAEDIAPPPPELLTLADVVPEARERMQKGSEVVGLSSGFKTIDRLTMGFENGELITLAGNTSHGKSQLAQNIAYRVARAGDPVLIISLEDPAALVTARLLKIGHDSEETSTLPIIYPKSKEIKVANLDPLIHQAIEKFDIKLVIVDHLHYFGRSIDNSSAEIGKLVREFKGLAIKHDLPVLLISHITKLREDVMPTLEHLRDSSFIAQDSDIVLFVWRDKEANDDRLQIKIEKNRNRGLPKKRSEELIIVDQIRLTERVV